MSKVVLPFGLSLAPHISTKCSEAVLTPIRGEGVRVLDYLDDLLILVDLAHQAEAHTSRLLTHLQSLVFLVNQEKSSFIPSHKICFLGLELNSIENRARLSSWRIVVFNRCPLLFHLHHIVRLHQCQRLLGLMTSMMAVVPLGLLLIREFQHWVHIRQAFSSSRGNGRMRVTQSESSREQDLDRPGEVTAYQCA